MSKLTDADLDLQIIKSVIVCVGMEMPQIKIMDPVRHWSLSMCREFSFKPSGRVVHKHFGSMAAQSSSTLVLERESTVHPNTSIGQKKVSHDRRGKTHPTHTDTPKLSLKKGLTCGIRGRITAETCGPGTRLLSSLNRMDNSACTPRPPPPKLTKLCTSSEKVFPELAKPLKN